MVEYTVILAFGGLMLLGPGGDLIGQMLDVLKNNYRAYSYSMSLSTLPDFETGLELGGYVLLQDPDVDGVTLARLTEDPYTTAVGRLNAAFGQLTGALPGMANQITNGGFMNTALQLYNGNANTPLPPLPPPVVGTLPAMPAPPPWPPSFP